MVWLMLLMNCWRVCHLSVYLRRVAQLEVLIVVSIEECVVARFEVKVAV